MKKHRIDKIQEISGTTEKEISPEHDKQNREWIANKLLEIVAKTPKDSPPVKESFDELLAQLKNPKRAPVVIQTFDGKRIEVCEGNTRILSGGESIFDEKKATNHNSDGARNSSVNTKTDTGTFNENELLILEQFKNGTN